MAHTTPLGGPGVPSPQDTSVSVPPLQAATQKCVGADNRFVKAMQEKSTLSRIQGLALTSEPPESSRLESKKKPDSAAPDPKMTALAATVSGLRLTKGEDSPKQEVPDIFFPDNFACGVAEEEGSGYFLSREQCAIVGSFQRTAKALQQLREKKGVASDMACPINEINEKIYRESQQFSGVYLIPRPTRTK